jgi:hypothetical protein
MESLLEDPITMEPFACEAGALATPLVLPCGHTLSYTSIERVSPSSASTSVQLGGALPPVARHLTRPRAPQS